MFLVPSDVTESLISNPSKSKIFLNLIREVSNTILNCFVSFRSRHNLTCFATMIKTTLSKHSCWYLAKIICFTTQPLLLLNEQPTFNARINYFNSLNQISNLVGICSGNIRLDLRTPFCLRLQC